VIIPKLEEYTKIGPDNPEAWEILSFASWLSGDQLAPKEKKAKLEWFNKGEAAADKILAKNPQSPAGLFWKSTNMASIADVKGWMSSLWMYPTLASNMKLVDQPSAPPFLYGATDRFWCEVLARVPLFLANKFGHSVSEITAKMEQQIQREPRFFANYTYAARLYWKVDNKKRALELLEYVLKHDPTIFHEERAYNKLHQLEAHKLWLEFTGKEFSKK
jgi:tetratricopeptide (TPR) repeat protein